MSMRRGRGVARMSVVGGFVVSLAAVNGAVHGGETISTWNGPVGGNWNVAGSWLPMIVPNNGVGDTYAVVVTPAGNGLLLVNFSPTVNSLAIDFDDVVRLLNGQTLTIAGGALTLDGRLEMASVGNLTDLRFAADTQINDAMTVGTGAFLTNRIYGLANTVRMTVGPDASVVGSMSLGVNQMRLTNNGLVQSENAAGMSIDLTDGLGNFNNGVIRSAPGSTLNITGTTFENDLGTIAAGPATTVSFTSSRVNGGLLDDEDGVGAPGVLRFVGSNFLNAVTLQGDALLPNGHSLQIENDLALDDALITLASVGNLTDLRIETPLLAPTGDGAIVGSNFLTNRIYGLANTHRLVVPATIPVRGGFSFGVNQMRLTNDGLIQAEGSSGIQLDLTDGLGNLNNGVIRSATGSTLNISGTTFENDLGTIAAGPATTVTFTTARVNGGLLDDEDGVGAPGVLRFVGSNILKAVTLHGDALLPNSHLLQIEDDLALDDGRISLASVGNLTDLRLETPLLEPTGNGEIVGSNFLTNRIYGLANTHRLVVPPTIPVRGGFSIGFNQMRLTNNGLIQAEGSAGIQLDLTDGPGNVNNGVIRSAPGSTLNIAGTTWENDLGTIAAGAGTTVTFTSARVIGGLLDDEDGVGAPGVHRFVGTNFLNGVTLIGDAILPNGSSLFLEGDVHNDGRFQIASVGNLTDLRLDVAAATLGGVGETVLSAFATNRIYAINNTFTLTIGAGQTVRGAGSLGINMLRLVNDGAIVADAGPGFTIDPTDSGIGFVNNGLLHANAANVTIGLGPATNFGTVRIDASRTLTRSGAAYVQEAGVTEVAGILSSAPGVTINGGELRGTGQVVGPVVNVGGVVGPGASAGTLSLGAAYVQQSGGALSVEIGGSRPGQSDVLAVSGTATLAGTLRVARINGFVPDPRELFTVLTAGTISGTFQSIVSCDEIEVIYDLPNAVKVRFPASGGPVGDLNGDGVVDGADLGILLTAWGLCSGDPCCIADVTGDGAVDGADLGVLLNNWTFR